MWGGVQLVAPLPHSLHGDMQRWQTRLGARANLVARAEHAGDSMPREMIVHDRIRLIGGPGTKNTP